MTLLNMLLQVKKINKMNKLNWNNRIAIYLGYSLTMSLNVKSNLKMKDMLVFCLSVGDCGGSGVCADSSRLSAFGCSGQSADNTRQSAL